MRLTLPLLLLSATPALAQPVCEAPSGPLETCLVGAWVGSSTIPQALEQAMRSMPDNVAANFSSFGVPVAMIIYDDGFFETFPITADGFATFVDSEGDVTSFEMVGQTVTTAGYISAIGGTLDLCYLPGALGNLNGEMTVTTNGESTTVPLFAVPENTFNPVISYSCSGDSMQQNVALPAPLGTITYNLTRVPLDAFGDARREVVE
ncbi:hypothetical protein [Hasllibacter sp. MH4015]|uniref:hypothetical protein n=1 Tax=Hasllibacter sp. MH4015 TaxID=2854029 RepID=UPI001CD62A50|nr:hypothetical protein [Hasllibacter sp. MH4015]